MGKRIRNAPGSMTSTAGRQIPVFWNIPLAKAVLQRKGQPREVLLTEGLEKTCLPGHWLASVEGFGRT